MFEQIRKDMDSGTTYPITTAQAGISAPGFTIPDRLTPLLNCITESPLVMSKPPLKFTSDINILSEHESALKSLKSTLIDEKYVIIGIEESGMDYCIAVDIQTPELPVLGLNIHDEDELPEELRDEDEDSPEGSAEILDEIAPSLTTFLAALDIVHSHYTQPLYSTPPRTEFEKELIEELEDLLGKDAAQTWWPGRLSEGKFDYFWRQFSSARENVSYQDWVADSVDQEESLFSLFSIIPFKREKGVKFFTVIEDPQFVPLLFDVLAGTDDTVTEEHLVTAICNCRNKAVPYLKKALQTYPTSAGRKTAARLLKELEYTEIEPPILPDQDKPSVYNLEWPPFDESDLSGIKYISLLLIFLGALFVGGVFYVVNRSILSMIFGASAMIVVSIFLPDFGLFLLRKKLAAFGYDERLIDFETLVEEIKHSNVLRIIDYTKDDIAASQGYLVYLRNDAETGDLRPRILLCSPEQYSDQVIEWYETDAIPADGPRSKMIKSFWNSDR